MPHPRVEAFSQIPHRRWMGTRGPGVDGHAWNWLKWCNLYFQKLVELSFAADEVSLVALSQFLFLFLFQGINWKRICIFPWNNLILSVSPNMNKSKNLLPSLRAIKFSGALASAREKEGELATTSLEFEYLHRKSQCEMLIGGDDISHYPWHLFFNICSHLLSFPLRADWRKSNSSVDGNPHGNWRWKSNSRDVVASSPSFSRPDARAPRRACSKAISSLASRSLVNLSQCYNFN